MAHKDEKELNFELNLLPVISMLSCCICFLLLTAVWTHIGTMNIQQALGQESTRSDQTQASLWASMKSPSEINFSIKDLKSSRSLDWEQIRSYANQVHRVVPGLKTALILPHESVAYGDVIKVMDAFKQAEISEVGIAPM